jgi:hypothetical protein
MQRDHRHFDAFRFSQIAGVFLGSCQAPRRPSGAMNQILGHLRVSRVEHGLLMNFGAPKFAIKKYALSRVGNPNFRPQ